MDGLGALISTVQVYMLLRTPPLVVRPPAECENQCGDFL